MRKRQAKKIEKKRRKKGLFVMDEFASLLRCRGIAGGFFSLPRFPGLMESFNKAAGCGVALVESEQSISDLK